MIKKFFKDITGITAKEAAEKEQALIQQKTAQRKIELAEKRRIAKEYKKEKEAELKLTPKEIATKKKEPWVDVIGFNINKDNIRNGFYELDWNEYFIAELKREEYGFEGDPEEEIVSRWFRDICINAAMEEGVDMTDRSSGYINVTKLANGKSEVK